MTMNSIKMSEMVVHDARDDHDAKVDGWDGGQVKLTYGPRS
jgi:hypothetical protein